MFYSPGSDDTAAQELAHARTHFFLPHRYRDPFHTEQFDTETVVTYDDYKLLVLETRDALGNTVPRAERLSRAAPRLMTDPNGNRSEVAFDALGMVVGTAVMGKTGAEPLRATRWTDFEADLTDAVIAATTWRIRSPIRTPFCNAPPRGWCTTCSPISARKPTPTRSPPSCIPWRAKPTTPTSGGAQTKIQHSFSYSDGFGREIQKKIQAEPGPVPKRDAEGKIIVGADGQPEMTPNDVSPRWVGSGWTVFNNKGKPVRQYEPFFTDTHRFEFDVRIGVSPVLFYDPVERVVATLHPNHTWEKVVFDPWRQETWDVNDTVLVADPKTDPDVGDFFRRLPDGGVPADLACAATVQSGAARRAPDAQAARATKPQSTPTRRPSPTSTRSGAPSSPSPTTSSSAATHS